MWPEDYELYSKQPVPDIKVSKFGYEFMDSDDEKTPSPEVINQLKRENAEERLPVKR